MCVKTMSRRFIYCLLKNHRFPFFRIHIRVLVTNVRLNVGISWFFGSLAVVKNITWSWRLEQIVEPVWIVQDVLGSVKLLRSVSDFNERMLVVEPAARFDEFGDVCDIGFLWIITPSGLVMLLSRHQLGSDSLGIVAPRAVVSWKKLIVSQFMIPAFDWATHLHNAQVCQVPIRGSCDPFSCSFWLVPQEAHFPRRFFARALRYCHRHVWACPGCRPPKVVGASP